MKTATSPDGRPGSMFRRKGWVWGLSVLLVFALMSQSGLPFFSGLLVAQAAGPGGPSGSVTHTTAADFGQVCAVQSGTTVTNYNTNGEVRLLASLEDYFSGTDVDTGLWDANWVYDWYQVYPVVSGGLLTLDGSYLQSLQNFEGVSGRFVEARALVRSTSATSSNVDIGYYRNAPPSPPSPEAPITEDSAMRIFLVDNGGSNNLFTRLADGTTAYADVDVDDPDLTQWHLFRIEWGATDTVFYLDGTPISTMPEQLAGGDALIARVLLYHLNPSSVGPAPMQVDWVRAGQYPASGTYTSCVYDAGGVVNFSDINWTALVPSGSGLTIQTRTSLDNVTWSSLSSPINAGSGSSSSLTNPSGRYFQYVLNFTSSDLINSAEMQQVQFNYYGPNRLEVLPGTANVNPGGTQAFTATAYDANDDVVSGVTVDWSSTVGSVNASGVFTAPLTAGSFSNAVTATVNLSPSGTISDSADVSVPNLPPTANANGPYSGNEGSAISLSGSGSDPNGGSVTFAWDLDNNGSYETSGQNINNTWNDNGSFTVGLRVTDSTALSTTTTATVTVSNVAPTATFNAPASVNEGGSISLSLTAPSDPSSADTTAGFEYAFDCGSGYGSYSATSTASCPTTDSGSRSVGGRIRDKDGGVTTYTDSVTINNVAPTATFNAPATGTEGTAFALSLTAPSDPSSVDTTAGFEYAFDCGSGFGSYGASSTANCTPTDNGVVAVGGRIRDKDGGVTTYTDDVTVSNVAPTATFNAPASVNEGGSISLSLTAPSDPSSADTTAGFQYAFDCGSGYGSYSATSTASCPTTDSGSRSVGGRIRDKDGGVTTYTDSVTINNVAPTATFNAPATGTEGTAFALSLTAPSDPSSVDTTAGFEYAFDCGSGFGSYGASSTANCTPTDNGVVTVGGRIRDKDGGVTTYTDDVTVSNVAPTATFNAPVSVNEGGSIALSLTAPSDPSSVDTTAGFQYAFDCGSGYGSYSATSTASCPTTDSGSRSVGGRIRDKDGGVTTYTDSVTINNVAPTATFNAPATGTEGTALALSLTSPVDPSSVDMGSLQYAFDCGSGFGSYGASSTANCTPTDSGTITMRGRIRDKDGGVSEYSDEIDVANVAPTANAFSVSPSLVNEGQNVSVELVAPFNDPSSVDMLAGFTFAFDCGAGFGSYGSTTSTVCAMGNSGTVTVRGRIRDKDGAYTEYTGDVSVNNVPPQVVSVTNDGPTLVGQPVQITVNVSAYAGDTLQYEFDCDDNGSYELGPQSSNVGVCTFSTEGLHTVTVRVTDDDDESDTGTTEVEIKNYLLFLPLITK